METNEISQTIKEWIALDDEERALRAEVRKFSAKKIHMSRKILEFMRTNEIDKFALEGSGVGTLSRSVRVSKPPIKRANIRKSLIMYFADQPDRVASFLRDMDTPLPVAEGELPEPKQTERLIRTIPKEKKTVN
jgi:hypothetical protein